jgi:hypothetical protein
LVERGEIRLNGYGDMLRPWSQAVSNAFGIRVQKDALQDWVRRPSFVFAVATVLFLLTAAVSRGFSATRALLEVAGQIHFGRSAPGTFDPALETLVPYGIMFTFALATGIALIAMQRQPLRGYSLRYPAFLAGKAICVVVLGPILWVESSALVRSIMPATDIRLFIPGLLFGLAFLFGFAFALGWSFTDQRRRCPTCLKRMAMPVTIGTWSSQLEPVSTELLCDQGHGSLCLPETETGQRDRWTSHDPSWQELFETVPTPGNPGTRSR